MAKIKTYDFAWDPSPDQDVAGYVVCWAIPPAIVGDGSSEQDYDIPTKVDVGNVTQVVLPLLGMPINYDGNLSIGVWAYDDVGNKSDIAKIVIPLDLIAPSAPGNLRLI